MNWCFSVEGEWIGISTYGHIGPGSGLVLGGVGSRSRVVEGPKECGSKVSLVCYGHG